MSTPGHKLATRRYNSRFSLADKPSSQYESEYRSLFAKWDDISWLRAKSRDVVPFEPELNYYAESLATLFVLPKVRESSEEVRKKLLIHHLYIYLEFTVQLELGPVNEVCRMLSQSDFLPWLPQEMKDDALKIYMDEGGHADACQVLMKMVEKETNVSRIQLQPAFLGLLDDLVAEEEPEYRNVIKLFFVVISETLITGTLNKLPKDETVQMAVRNLASHHANDERRHHAYFLRLFEYVWLRMPRELRIKIGFLLPRMILAFLSPDEHALVQILKQFPEVFHLPGELVSEALSNADIKAGIVRSAEPTLRILKNSGMFGEPEIAAVFAEHKLVDAANH